MQSSRQARTRRSAISPRLAMRILRREATSEGILEHFSRAFLRRRERARDATKSEGARIAGSLHLISCAAGYLLVSTPGLEALFAFSTLALRAPSAFCVQSSACCISAFRASALPHSISALRRYARLMYAIASS